MKRSIVLLTLVLPLLTAGCGAPISHVAGVAAPVTSPSPAPPSRSAPAIPAVLGPDGFGALKLGMTAAQASATGLIDRWPAGVDGCAQNTFLKAATGTATGAEGRVYLNDRGIQIIEAFPGIRTPEGVGVGTRASAMLKLYPGWRNVADENPRAEGRGEVAVPGNRKAVYRIVTVDGVVTELALQDRKQDCYE